MIGMKLTVTLFSDIRQCLVKYFTGGIIIPALIMAGIFYVCLPEVEVSQPPGVLAPEKPRRSPAAVTTPFQLLEYTITPLADYDITARVLGKNIYHWSDGADIAPVDLVLGWQAMSDTAILKNFQFHLSGRWYSWHANYLPLSQNEVNQDLDNNHLIPATRDIEKKLRHVHIGQLIRIQGLLVSMARKDGYVWTTSFSEGSTGGPLSCKLIYVLDFDVLQ